MVRPPAGVRRLLLLRGKCPQELQAAARQPSLGLTMLHMCGSLLKCCRPALLPCMQVMLKPIAQALNAVIEPTTQVWFAMQGARCVCVGGGGALSADTAA